MRPRKFDRVSPTNELEDTDLEINSRFRQSVDHFDQAVHEKERWVLVLGRLWWTLMKEVFVWLSEIRSNKQSGWFQIAVAGEPCIWNQRKN